MRVMQLVFETHSVSEDNERGIASGWLHRRLSERGRSLASELGERRREVRAQVEAGNYGKVVDVRMMPHEVQE